MDWTSRQQSAYTVDKTLAITRRRSNRLLRPSRRRRSNFFPEIHEIGTVRKIFPPGFQISHSNNLKPHGFYGSSKNILDLKTLIQHIKLIFHPFSKLNISALSAKQDLHNHGKKIAKGDGRIFTYLNCSDQKSCSPASRTSRSSPMLMPRSFVHKESTETS